jgi:hypothetical protein
MCSNEKVIFKYRLLVQILNYITKNPSLQPLFTISVPKTKGFGDTFGYRSQCENALKNRIIIFPINIICSNEKVLIKYN